MKWLWFGVGTILYWACAVAGLFFVVTVHGDCWGSQIEAEVRSCVDEKRLLMWTYIAVALALYVFSIWRLGRPR